MRMRGIIRCRLIQRSTNLIQKVRMRLVVTAVLVAYFLGVASCRLDCAFPTNSDIESVLIGIIGIGESSALDINVIDFTPRCLAVSEERGRYRAISVLVNYTCEGDASCPTGRAREQIESECDDGEWSNVVLGSTVNTREPNPADTPISDPTREYCAFCASPDISNDVIGRQSDNVSHCVGE